MRHCSLLFAGQALGQRDYIELWENIEGRSSTVEEVVGNFFIRSRSSGCSMKYGIWHI